MTRWGREGTRLDIAVVGMACRFPGAPDLATFAQNVLTGVDAIGPVPPGRWDPAVFVDPDSRDNDRIPTARGGYLAHPIRFDPLAHGIMPHAVDGGEPEQFLVLDAAHAALADAGLAAGVPDGRRVEVVVGRGNYFNRGNLARLQHGRIVAQTLQILDALHPDWTEADRVAVRAGLKASLPPFNAATIPGQMTNATAGRVGNRLDLRGATFVVDAASASSLVALDLATRSLRSGRAHLAVVGGVYLEANVDFPMVFHQLGALSPSGRCRPFAADADGTLSGEGVGVVVLKRREDADRDGDRVYAVIQGVGVASDGRGQSLAAPSAKGHARAIRLGLRRAGVDPATVGLIEGHGLGVPAADRAELRALRAVFPPVGPGRRVLGAVSSAIGHAMPAAGIAAIIKTALALHHRVLPPTLHAPAKPNRRLAGPDPGFALLEKARPWVHGDEATPRRAGVNAFGFSGINAHAVLESHQSSDRPDAPGVLLNWDSEAFLLAAPDRPGLIVEARRLRKWLDQANEAATELPVKDLAYTLNTRATRSGGTCRLGLVAGSVEELVARLDAVLARLEADLACRTIRDPRGAYFVDRPAGEGPGGVAFCFPGEGSQYPGMLADLLPHFPEVRALFDTSDRIAREGGATTWPSEHLFASSGTDDPELWAAGVAVNVVLSAQWALYQLLRRLGLRPDAVVGHSSGELLALAAAGVVAVDRAFETRLGDLGALFGDLETRGNLPKARLAAVAAPRAKVEAACEAAGVGPDVAVAMDNCPRQVVVAGPPEAVGRVVERLQANGAMVSDLPFGRAYHTAGFLPALEPLATFFAGLDLQPPPVPIYSCASADRMPSDPAAICRLAVEQWVRPVRFRETVAKMHADGLRVFVDVGARGNLAGFVEDTLRGQPALAVAANLPRRSGLAQLNHLVATLFAHGVDLDPTHLYQRRRPVQLDLDRPPVPRTVAPALAVGFPEMRLPADLVARLTRSPDKTNPAPDIRPADKTNPTPGDAWLDKTNPSPDQTNPTLVNGRNGYHPHVEPGPVFEPAPVAVADDDPMLVFQATMASFLQTQHEVMTAYLGSPVAEPVDAPPAPGGPWAGDLVEFEPGVRAVSTLVLQVHGDPVAEHHTLGGRRVSAVHREWRGLPVLPFAVMAEAVAEAAARLCPGLALASLDDVRAHRWIRYEDEPIAVEIHARLVPGSADAVAVALHNRGPAHAPRPLEPPVFEGVARFAPTRPAPPISPPFAIQQPRPCRFTAESIYAEQWLFHGPALQAVSHVGAIGPDGIVGRLRKLPLAPLARDPGEAGGMLTDPAVIDNFTHLLGAWGLDQLRDDGDVIFPLRVERLAFFGPDPAEGDEVECRIHVTACERHRIGARADLVRDDGTTWISIEGWEDWRFHWPGRYRDGFRQPDRTFLGERLPLPGAGPGVVAVWLEPPGDMGRPVWRDVLEHVQLGPDERAAMLALPGPEARRTHRLWGRIAAKEAARRLWADRGLPPTYPADLLVVPDDRGRPVLQTRIEGGPGLPAVSIAHADGVAVAIASEAGGPVGIDVEAIKPRSAGFEAQAFTPAERTLLDRFPGETRAEGIARFWCAKEAAGKATGLGLIDGPGGVEAVAVSADIEGDGTGLTVMVRFRAGLVAARPDLAGRAFRVQTGLRDDWAWAWTVLDEEDATS